MGIDSSGFGPRVKELAALAGASFRGLDSRAGLAPGYTAMIVSGAKGEPGLLTALRIVSAFGLGRDGRLWLLAGDGQPPSAERARAGYLAGAAGGGVHAPRVRHRKVPRNRVRPSSGARSAGRARARG
jgi:hypothetical protein